MKIKLSRFDWLLLAITLLSFILRFYHVDKIPPSLTWDEVSIGYNAYSILKTGFDEHHRFLPLDAFIAYGDYKPPLPVYMTVPFVAFFGLTERSIRLPSVVFGTLTVMLTYYLTKELIKFTSSTFKIWYVSIDIPVIAAALMAISPWHIQLSRVGFEANIALFFVVLGVFLVLISRRYSRLMVLCWIPFVAAIYTFNSARYFVPLMGLVLIFYCWREFRTHLKYLFIGFILAVVLLTPILPHLLSPQSRLRFTEVNIFTDPTVVHTANERIGADDNAWWATILHNRRIGYLRNYFIHYFENFEPWFLFIRGDGNPKFSIQDVGQMYLIEAPFLVLGILFMMRAQHPSAWLLLSWILLSIVPAATARETPHALRIENSLPTWQIFTAYGFMTFIQSKKANWLKKFVTIISIVLLAGNVLYYLHNYYNHYAIEYSGEWQYGYREALQYIKSIENRYQNIVITDSIGRAYAYTLFYQRYPPEELWRTKTSTFDTAGFYHVLGFGKYQFVTNVVPGAFVGQTLYVLPPEDVPRNIDVLKTIKRLDNKSILVIFDTL